MTMQISYLGNSIIYFNDTPNVLKKLGSIEQRHSCCLRGGASLVSLVERGSNMKRVFKEGSDYGSDTTDDLLGGGRKSRRIAWDFVGEGVRGGRGRNNKERD